MQDDRFDEGALKAIPGRAERTWNRLYYSLVGAAVALSCIIFVCRGGAEASGRIWVFAVAAVFLWPETKAPTASRLQSVCALYLCYIPLEQAARSRLVFSAWGCRLSVSMGVAAAGLLLAGFFADVLRRGGRTSDDPNAVCGIEAWALCCAVLLAHAVFLAALLSQAYGYGYEKSPILFGKIGLFFLACVALRRALRTSLSRRLVGATLAVAYVAAALLGGLGVSR